MVQTKNKTAKLDTVVKDGAKVGAVKTTNRNPRKSRSRSRVRECLKEEPLEPLYTGKIKKPKPAKRPKFSTKKSKIPQKISKVKSADQKSQPSSTSTSSSSSRKPTGAKPTGRSWQEKPRGRLPTVVVEKEDFQSEVIFQPRLTCRSCLAGRKGEGGNDCWSCRLTRLQNIQEEKMKSLN